MTMKSCRSERHGVARPRGSMLGSRGPFNDYDVEAVVQATQEFEKKTCVRFQPHAGETDFIHIQDLGGKSWSLPGKQGGEQPLSLEPGKVTKGIVLHELMHALGFQHEHCRSDRDDHVWVVPENVKKEWKEQIVDINSNEQDLVAPYDCSSIMHYSMLAGSVDERNPTIIPRDVLCMLHMGQSNSLSPCDVVKVQKLYGYEAEVHAAPAAVARRSRTSADEDAPLHSNVGVWKICKWQACGF
ncbi:astacin-like metalloprotease toxin 5 [Lethenteron reissneri]|uniref:astacin-like metalloprotease toxin 5 n=1 Tax=Lethenteron reissneri TaxID=7753 RepID=UPI002AB7B8A3|nr:astacin-like metalloprotease toxin 5 [Lethenteron reissneri]